MSARGARFARSAARPASVAAVVAAVCAGLRATLAVECVLLGLAGVLAARAAALLSTSGPGAWPLAGLCGALSAAAWWREHPLARAETAAALDRRLRHHGALVTAWELEARAAAGGLSSMEELVRARVLARLRFAEAFQALFRPLFVPIGAPLAAALALLLVVDARRAPPASAADLGALSEGLARALDAAAPLELGSRAEVLAEDEDGQRALQKARALSAQLSRALSSAAGAPADAELEARLAELDRGLAELAARTETDGSPPGHAPPERLAEARVWLDALRTGLRARAGAAAGGTGPGPGTGAAADGTISPPRSAPDSMQGPPPSAPDSAATPGAAALGLQSGSFWPPEYDAVVERWVELSRAAAEESRAR